MTKRTYKKGTYKVFNENTQQWEKDPLMDVPLDIHLEEYESLVKELSEKEVQYLEIKETIFDKEQWIIENTDFKQVYGKNNSNVRKLHFQKHMKKEYNNRKDLEISIDYLKRRISFVKTTINTKITILQVIGVD